ncbi:MAG: DUF3047 domain-containing protein, partial [Smithellaceae bacterium]|nr:DUF3047 domain-containing protein [Smithellaceae bacterium]
LATGGVILMMAIFLPLVAIPAASTNDNLPVAVYRAEAIKNGVPAGWELETKEGTPLLQFQKEGNAFYLHLIGDGQSAFGIRREVKVDIQEYPYLNWRWKAVKLPQGGDVRKSETDDQVLQLYIAFSPTGFPAMLNTPVVGYIWDNKPPKDWTGRSAQPLGNMVRYVVMRNKTDKLDQWYGEKRNILQDYQNLFREEKGGVPQGPTKGVQIYINTQYTKSEAEGYIGEVFFSRN